MDLQALINKIKNPYNNKNIIFRYVSQEFIFSLFVAFLFFFFIFFVNQILYLAEKILEKNVPIKDVLLLIFYSLPLILSLSLPFGTLVGSLMTVGRLNTDNEILALRASGVSIHKIFMPLIIIGVVFSFLSFYINDYYLPKGTIGFTNLYRQMIYRNPELELEPYSIKKYEKSIIITGKIENKIIYDLVIIDEDTKKNNRVICAKKAILEENSEQQGIISLQLKDVQTNIVDQKKKESFETISSDLMIYNILLKNISQDIKNPGPSEMSSRDTYRIIKEKEKDYFKQISDKKYQTNKEIYSLSFNYLNLIDNYEEFDKISPQIITNFKTINNMKNKRIKNRSLQLYRLELHKKFALPASCFIFVLLAFPVGMFTKKSGRNVGFGIGLLFSILYWGLLFTGHTMGLRLNYSPVIFMWMPNFVILILALIFYLLRLKK